MTDHTAQPSLPPPPAGSQAEPPQEPPQPATESTLWTYRLIAWIADISAVLLAFVALLVVLLSNGGGNVIALVILAAYPAICVWSLTSAGATPGQRLATVRFAGRPPSVGRAIVYTVLRPALGPVDVLSLIGTKKSLGDQVIGAELQRNLPTTEQGRRWRARAIDLGVAGAMAYVASYLLPALVGNAASSNNSWAVRVYNDTCEAGQQASPAAVNAADSEELFDAASRCLRERDGSWISYAMTLAQTSPTSVKLGVLVLVAVIVLLPVLMIRRGRRTVGQRLFDAPEVRPDLSDARTVALVVWRLSPLLVLPLVLVLPVWLVVGAVIAVVAEPWVRKGNSVTDQILTPPTAP